jgi:proteasome component ECM29
MDDIKESVRAAAAKLIRTLRGLTLRLCDPAHTPRAHSTAATAVVIPLLLSTKGVGADAAEVRALAVTTIAKICALASAEQLQVSEGASGGGAAVVSQPN